MKSALMLAVNPDAVREVNDFYATDPQAIEIAIPTFEKLGLNSTVWECACGQGHISKVLEKHGYDVYSTDLINRGFGEVKDFLTCEETFDGDILTNPPFKFSIEFVRKGIELLKPGNKLFLFLKIQFLESRKRKELFQVLPPKYVAVYTERQKCAKDGEFGKYCKNSNTQLWAWFVWEKGFSGEPKIVWI